MEVDGNGSKQDENMGEFINATSSLSLLYAETIPAIFTNTTLSLSATQWISVMLHLNDMILFRCRAAADLCASIAIAFKIG